MAPKEKAEEVVDKMYYSRKYKDGEDYIPQEAWVHAKQCALIAVNEIMSLMIKFHNRHIEDNSNEIIFWEEVKQEIEKL